MDEIDKFIEEREKKIDKLRQKHNNLEEENYYCDENLINITEGEIPNFAKMVFTDTYLTEDAKNQFKKKFWKKFSNVKNLKYRESVIGKYLFWFNQTFIGVIDDMLECKKYGNPRIDNRFLIQITNLRETEYSSFSIDSNYGLDKKTFTNVINTFKIKLTFFNIFYFITNLNGI